MARTPLAPPSPELPQFLLVLSAQRLPYYRLSMTMTRLATLTLYVYLALGGLALEFARRNGLDQAGRMTLSMVIMSFAPVPLLLGAIGTVIRARRMEVAGTIAGEMALRRAMRRFLRANRPVFKARHRHARVHRRVSQAAQYADAVSARRNAVGSPLDRAPLAPAFAPATADVVDCKAIAPGQRRNVQAPSVDLTGPLSPEVSIGALSPLSSTSNAAPTLDAAAGSPDTDFQPGQILHSDASDHTGPVASSPGQAVAVATSGRELTSPFDATSSSANTTGAQCQQPHQHPRGRAQTGIGPMSVLPPGSDHSLASSDRSALGKSPCVPFRPASASIVADGVARRAMSLQPPPRHGKHDTSAASSTAETLLTGPEAVVGTPTTAAASFDAPGRGGTTAVPLREGSEAHALSLSAAIPPPPALRSARNSQARPSPSPSPSRHRFTAAPDALPAAPTPLPPRSRRQSLTGRVRVGSMSSPAQQSRLGGASTSLGADPAAQNLAHMLRTSLGRQAQAARGRSESNSVSDGDSEAEGSINSTSAMHAQTQTVSGWQASVRDGCGIQATGWESLGSASAYAAPAGAGADVMPATAAIRANPAQVCHTPAAVGARATPPKPSFPRTAALAQQSGPRLLAVTSGSVGKSDMLFMPDGYTDDDDGELVISMGTRRLSARVVDLVPDLAQEVAFGKTGRRTSIVGMPNAGGHNNHTAGGGGGRRIAPDMNGVIYLPQGGHVATDRSSGGKGSGGHVGSFFSGIASATVEDAATFSPAAAENYLDKALLPGPRAGSLQAHKDWLLSSEFDVELMVRFLMRRPTAKKVLLCKALLQEALEVYPRSVYIRVVFTTFLLNWAEGEEVMGAVSLLADAGKLPSAIDLRYEVYSKISLVLDLKRKAQLGSVAGLVDSIQLIEFRKEFTDAFVHHGNAIHALASWWHIVASGGSNDMLRRALRSNSGDLIRHISDEVLAAETKYLRLIQRYPKANAVLRAYGLLLINAKVDLHGMHYVMAGEEADDEDDDEDDDGNNNNNEEARDRQVNDGTSRLGPVGSVTRSRSRNASKTASRAVEGSAPRSLGWQVSENGALTSKETVQSRQEAISSRSRLDLPVISSTLRFLRLALVLLLVAVVGSLISGVWLFDRLQLAVETMDAAGMRRKLAESAWYGARGLQLLAADTPSNATLEAYAALQAHLLQEMSTLKAKHHFLHESGERFPEINALWYGPRAVVFRMYNADSPTGQREWELPLSLWDAGNVFVSTTAILARMDATRLRNASTLSEWRFVMDNAPHAMLAAFERAVRVYEARVQQVTSEQVSLQTASLALKALGLLVLLFLVFWPAVVAVAASKRDVRLLVEALPRDFAKHMHRRFRRVDRILASLRATGGSLESLDPTSKRYQSLRSTTFLVAVRGTARRRGAGTGGGVAGVGLADRGVVGGQRGGKAVRIAVPAGAGSNGGSLSPHGSAAHRAPPGPQVGSRSAVGDSSIPNPPRTPGQAGIGGETPAGFLLRPGSASETPLACATGVSLVHLRGGKTSPAEKPGASQNAHVASASREAGSLGASATEPAVGLRQGKAGVDASQHHTLIAVTATQGVPSRRHRHGLHGSREGSATSGLKGVSDAACLPGTGLGVGPGGGGSPPGDASRARRTGHAPERASPTDDSHADDGISGGVGRVERAELVGVADLLDTVHDAGEMAELMETRMVAVQTGLTVAAAKRRGLCEDDVSDSDGDSDIASGGDSKAQAGRLRGPSEDGHAALLDHRIDSSMSQPKPHPRPAEFLASRTGDDELLGRKADFARAERDRTDGGRVSGSSQPPLACSASPLDGRGAGRDQHASAGGAAANSDAEGASPQSSAAPGRSAGGLDRSTSPAEQATGTDLGTRLVGQGSAAELVAAVPAMSSAQVVTIRPVPKARPAQPLPLHPNSLASWPPRTSSPDTTGTTAGPEARLAGGPFTVSQIDGAGRARARRMSYTRSGRLAVASVEQPLERPLSSGAGWPGGIGALSGASPRSGCCGASKCGGDADDGASSTGRCASLARCCLCRPQCWASGRALGARGSRRASNGSMMSAGVTSAAGGMGATMRNVLLGGRGSGASDQRWAERKRRRRVHAVSLWQDRQLRLVTLAICIVVVVLVASQVATFFVALGISVAGSTKPVILNNAGRRRYLAREVINGVRELMLADDEVGDFPDLVERLDGNLVFYEKVHNGLRRGDSDLGLPPSQLLYPALEELMFGTTDASFDSSVDLSSLGEPGAAVPVNALAAFGADPLLRLYLGASRELWQQFRSPSAARPARTWSGLLGVPKFKMVYELERGPLASGMAGAVGLLKEAGLAELANLQGYVTWTFLSEIAIMLFVYAVLYGLVRRTLVREHLRAADLQAMVPANLATESNGFGEWKKAVREHALSLGLETEADDIGPLGSAGSLAEGQDIARGTD